MKQDWLEGLTPGDTVVIDNRMNPRVRTVDRITKTQIIVGNCRFKRSNGFQVGQSRWDMVCLSEPTPERVSRVRHRELCAKLSNTRWSELPLETLEAVDALRKEAAKR